MNTWWDFAIAAMLLAGHGWLLVLSHRLAIVHGRLSRHICRDPLPPAAHGRRRRPDRPAAEDR